MPGRPSTLGVAQAPATTEGGKQTTMGNFGYATISEKSPNKEAAWEFVKWWTERRRDQPLRGQDRSADRAHRFHPALREQAAADRCKREFVPRCRASR